jgi:hypothetical protein
MLGLLRKSLNLAGASLRVPHVSRPLRDMGGFAGQHSPGLPPYAPNLTIARAFALAASSSRFFGGAVVSSE